MTDLVIDQFYPIGLGDRHSPPANNRHHPYRRNSPPSPEIEVKFEKWSILIPNLKIHALSYCNGKTVLNYGQCSKVCEAEIQTLNTNVPKTLSIRDSQRGLKVLIEFKNGQNYELEYIKRNDEFYCLKTTWQKNLSAVGSYVLKRGNIYEAAADYLERKFKYSKNGKMEKFGLSTKVWPEKVMNLQVIRKVENFTVRIYGSMADNLINFISDDSFISGTTTTVLQSNPEKYFKLPSKFFESKFFIGSKNPLKIDLPTAITDNDILSRHGTIKIEDCNLITDKGINQKILSWMYGEKHHSFKISLPLDDIRKWDAYKILEGVEFMQDGNNSYNIHGINADNAFLSVFDKMVCFQPNGERMMAEKVYNFEDTDSEDSDSDDNDDDED